MVGPAGQPQFIGINVGRPYTGAEAHQRLRWRLVYLPTLALAAVLASASAMAQPADICVPGYAREHRMPYAESAAIKREILPAGHSVSEYELDHIVPLCMGGSNDRSNLQLQPWDEAKRKDVDEWRLCRAVCAGWMSLDDAQRQMREWRP